MQVERMTASPTQQGHNPFDRFFPAFILFIAQICERVDCSPRSTLGFQVLREDGNVIIEPLKILALDGGYALGEFVAIRLRLYGLPWDSIDKLQGCDIDIEALKVGCKQFQVNVLPVATNLTDDVCGLRAFRE